MIRKWGVLKKKKTTTTTTMISRLLPRSLAAL
jgi:hypothetical protein